MGQFALHRDGSRPVSRGTGAAKLFDSDATVCVVRIPDAPSMSASDTKADLDPDAELVRSQGQNGHSCGGTLMSAHARAFVAFAIASGSRRICSSSFGSMA
jgi:hypothetical protein